MANQAHSRLPDLPSVKTSKAVKSLGKLVTKLPVMMQQNAKGEWVQKHVDDLDEEVLRSILEQMGNADAVANLQTISGKSEKYELPDGASNVLPVIMMSLQTKKTDETSESVADEEEEDEETEEEKKKKKKKAMSNLSNAKKSTKRPFVLQRFTDFDLLSQW